MLFPSSIYLRHLAPKEHFPVLVKRLAGKSIIIIIVSSGM